jgi:hypothetical protein
MKEWQGRKREPVTEERLERAVEVLAQIVKEHGPTYGPLYESVEQELANFRRLKQTVDGPAIERERMQGKTEKAPRTKKRLSA